MKHRAYSRILAATIAALLIMTLISDNIRGSAADYITTSAVTVNAAPVAESFRIETYRDVPITGELKSVDPEGDEVAYSITQDGRKGTVTVEGNTFTYTPGEGEKGKDIFCYVAIDSAGNISNEATVTVKIVKQRTEVMYSDLDGSTVKYAATYLAENGIFTGERVGDRYLYSPTAYVTRGDFLVMCLELVGLERTEGLGATGFADDEDIPDWQKPYVTTAVINDLVDGSLRSDGQIVFSADSPITFAEAAVILNNTLDITNVFYTDTEETIPVWACQAAANLESCDIIPAGFAKTAGEKVTRADAAMLLVGAAELLGRRETGAGLLNWARRG